MKILALILSVFILSGCSALSFLSWPGTDNRLTNEDRTLTEIRKPVLCGDVDGKQYVAEEIERHYTTSKSVTQPKLTFMQKIGNFISNLSWTAVIFIVVSLVFFGGAPIVWAVKKYFGLRNAFKNTIAGIRDLPPEVYEKATDTLAKAQDTADKKLVDKMKAELH